MHYKCSFFARQNHQLFLVLNCFPFVFFLVLLIQIVPGDCMLVTGDRFSLCCGVCNQPLERFASEQGIWWLVCPEVLAPFLCPRLDHSIYQTSVPLWFSNPDFNWMIASGLPAIHVNGAHLRVFERFVRRNKRFGVRDITVIYSPGNVGIDGASVKKSRGVLVTREGG